MGARSVERKTLYTVLRKVSTKSPKEIAEKTIEAVAGLNARASPTTTVLNFAGMRRKA